MMPGSRKLAKPSAGLRRKPQNASIGRAKKMLLAAIGLIRRKNIDDDSAAIKASIVADGSSVKNLDAAMRPSGFIPDKSPVRLPIKTECFVFCVQFSIVIPTQQPIVARQALKAMASTGQLIAWGSMPEIR